MNCVLVDISRDVVAMDVNVAIMIGDVFALIGG